MIDYHEFSIGDYCEHRYKSWYGKLEIVFINYARAEYDVVDEQFRRHTFAWEEIVPLKYKKVIDPKYCSCPIPELVESSIQVHRSMDHHEIFKYCRKCKKEHK